MKLPEDLFNFRKTQSIVDSSQLSRVESTANGMTNLAATVVISTVAIMLAAIVFVRLQQVKHLLSRK